MMSTEIDWSGWTEEFPLWVESHKPHIGKSDWHKRSSEGMLYDRYDCEWSSADEQDGTLTIHRRPEPVVEPGEWDGNGRPPLGARCEYAKPYRDGLVTCWFVGVNSSGWYLIETEDHALKAYHPQQITLRPALTPAQKELAARIITVAHMKELFKNDGIWGIYDAGYRLPGGEE